MPRVKKFGKLNKKILCANLTQARKVKRINANMRMTKKTLKDLFEETQEDGQQPEIPSTAEIVTKNDTAIEYWTMLKANILAQSCMEPYVPMSTLGVGICLHITTIGSSQLKKIGQQGFSKPKTFHGRVYSGQNQTAGREWEYYFETQASDAYQDQGLVVHELIKHKPRYSATLPWICATPDFIGRVATSPTTRSFVATIEIKSTTSLKTFKNTVKHHGEQVRASVDCFGLRSGYLITYLYDPKTADLLDTSVHRLIGSGYLQHRAKLLIDNYSKFLSRSIFMVTHEVLSPEAIKSDLIRIDPKPNLKLDLEDIKKIAPLVPVPKCVYHSHYVYRGLKACRPTGIKRTLHKGFSNLDK